MSTTVDKLQPSCSAFPFFLTSTHPMLLILSENNLFVFFF